LTLEQGFSNSVLEGRCPAEFSSNPDQKHLSKLIKVFRITIGWTYRLELNSAGQPPSRTEFEKPCSKVKKTGKKNFFHVPRTTEYLENVLIIKFC